MYKLPDLPYDFAALEPAISARIMELHHDKHHAGYVAKLNAAIESNPELVDKNLVDLLRNLHKVPESVRTAIRNQGGGHYNHSKFWTWMTPAGNGEPTGQLKTDLLAKYGDFQSFVDQFSTAATGVFGSGWAWLLPDLSITTTANQDVPLESGEPLLGLDVWEHAYYIDYHAARADYIKSWWNIVNWDEVASNYSTLK